LSILIVILLALGWAFGKFDRILSTLSPKLTSSWVIHNKLPPDGRTVSPETKTTGDPKK
jgi:hypothetical protein